jgi:hypothetical protein
MPDKVWVIVKTPIDADTEIVGVFGDKERAQLRFKEVLGHMWEGSYDGIGRTYEECIDLMKYANDYESLIVQEWVLVG